MGVPGERDWPAEHADQLRQFILAGAGTNSELAGLLNAKFGTSYSRNAVIGKASRLGLSTAGATPIKVPGEKAPRAPRVRIRKPVQIAPLRVRPPDFRCDEVVPRNLTLADLEAGDCRWPYGEGPFVFCGHAVTDDSSYCIHHFFASIGPGTESERAAASV